MSIQQRLLELTQHFVNPFLKSSKPLVEYAKLKESVRIVAHRGAYGPSRRENSMESFQRCLEDEIYGVEFDIRWTKDLVPVVFHDPNTKRTTGQDLLVSEMSFQDLKKRCPSIPSFEEALDLMGKKCKMFIELKELPDGNLNRKKEVLESQLSSYSPCDDYYLLTLIPDAIAGLNLTIPKEAMVVVGQLNLPELEEYLFNNGWGGIAGHYALVKDELIERCHRNGKKVGTGHISSFRILRREVSRGIDWHFSNDPLLLNQKVQLKSPEL